MGPAIIETKQQQSPQGAWVDTLNCSDETSIITQGFAFLRCRPQEAITDPLINSHASTASHADQYAILGVDPMLTPHVGRLSYRAKVSNPRPPAVEIQSPSPPISFVSLGCRLREGQVMSHAIGACSPRNFQVETRRVLSRPALAVLTVHGWRISASSSSRVARNRVRIVMSLVVVVLPEPLPI